MKKTSVTVVQHSFQKPSTGDSTVLAFRYEVTKLQNRINPAIGTVLSEVEIRQLITSRDTTVNILPHKHS